MNSRRASLVGEDEAADVAEADVGEHPLGFRVFHHRYARQAAA